MKPNRSSLLLVVAFAVSALVGCGSGGDMSSGDQQKMRDAMSPSRKEGAMTPDQKAGFEKWKANGSPTGAPGPAKAAPAKGAGG